MALKVLRVILVHFLPLQVFSNKIPKLNSSDFTENRPLAAYSGDPPQDETRVRAVSSVPPCKDNTLTRFP